MNAMSVLSGGTSSLSRFSQEAYRATDIAYSFSASST